MSDRHSDIAFLVIPTMILMDESDKVLQLRNVRMEVMEFGILVIISFHGAICQSALNIVRNEKRCPVSKKRIKLRQKDADASQVEVPEVDIAV